jgi:polyisoprenoid-binding protein YceI
VGEDRKQIDPRRGAARGPAGTPGPLPDGSWRIDAGHSEADFEVRHLGISRVRGRFGHLEGTIEAGPGALRVEGAVEVASLDTGDGERDRFLRSEQFFDEEHHPRIAFTASSTRALEHGRAEVEGELAIRGLQRPLTLAVSRGDASAGGEEPSRVAVYASGQLRRSDFDLSFPRVAGYADALVGETVKIRIAAEVVRVG